MISNPRQKLVKAIQLYEKLIQTQSERDEKLIQAVNDLKEQLKSMDKTSIHKDEMASNIMDDYITKQDVFEDSFYGQKIKNKKIKTKIAEIK